MFNVGYAFAFRPLVPVLFMFVSKWTSQIVFFMYTFSGVIFFRPTISIHLSSRPIYSRGFGKRCEITSKKNKLNFVLHWIRKSTSLCPFDNSLSIYK